MANNLEDPFADLRRRLEELFGHPPGAFDPGSTILRDMERINRALGRGFVQFQQIIGPQALLDRIEASVESPAAREVLDLPRRLMIWPKIWPDKVWRRRE